MTLYRYKIVVQYDGTNYHGWQIQKNHKTIQGELEKALSDLTSQNISICGSGRTDSGVHALAQVAHFDLLKKIIPESIINALNAKIDKDIRVLHCEIVKNDFHARFSATKRSYLYRLRTNTYILDRHYTHRSSPLDLKLLNKASQLLIGDYDFTSLTKNNPKISIRR